MRTFKTLWGALRRPHSCSSLYGFGESLPSQPASSRCRCWCRGSGACCGPLRRSTTSAIAAYKVRARAGVSRARLVPPCMPRACVLCDCALRAHVLVCCLSIVRTRTACSCVVYTSARYLLCKRPARSSVARSRLMRRCDGARSGACAGAVREAHACWPACMPLPSQRMLRWGWQPCPYAASFDRTNVLFCVSFVVPAVHSVRPR